MIFAVFDPSPLTLCINCSFFTFIFAVLLPVLSRLLIMSINTTFLDFSKVQNTVNPRINAGSQLNAGSPINAGPLIDAG